MSGTALVVEMWWEAEVADGFVFLHVRAHGLGYASTQSLADRDRYRGMVMLKQLAHLGMAIALTLTCQGNAMAEPAGHVTGIGGLFVKSKDPKALAKWYREVLGLDVKPWGGAVLPFDAPGHPPKVSWTPFPESSDYMAPSKREFMINFAVDDMDAIVARLTAHGVPILKRDDGDAFGRFAWIQDPDGTKIELWEPKRS